MDIELVCNNYDPWTEFILSKYFIDDNVIPDCPYAVNDVLLHNIIYERVLNLVKYTFSISGDTNNFLNEIEQIRYKPLRFSISGDVDVKNVECFLKILMNNLFGHFNVKISTLNVNDVNIFYPLYETIDNLDKYEYIYVSDNEQNYYTQLIDIDNLVKYVPLPCIEEDLEIASSDIYWLSIKDHMETTNINNMVLSIHGIPCVQSDYEVDKSIFKTLYFGTLKYIYEGYFTICESPLSKNDLKLILEVCDNFYMEYLKPPFDFVKCYFIKCSINDNIEGCYNRFEMKPKQFLLQSLDRIYKGKLPITYIGGNWQYNVDNYGELKNKLRMCAISAYRKIINVKEYEDEVIVCNDLSVKIPIFEWENMNNLRNEITNLLVDFVDYKYVENDYKFEGDIGYDDETKKSYIKFGEKNYVLFEASSENLNEIQYLWRKGHLLTEWGKHIFKKFGKISYSPLKRL